MYRSRVWGLTFASDLELRLPYSLWYVIMLQVIHIPIFALMCKSKCLLLLLLFCDDQLVCQIIGFDI